MNTIPYKTYLDENELPECWYNVRADMEKKPAPLLNPATGAPCTAEDLSHVFCEELVAQELDETTPLLYDQKLMEAVSVKQTDVFAAAQQFARGEADYRIVAVESRDTRRDRRGAQVQGRGQGGDDPLRAHRHRLLRHEGIRGVQRRNDERLRAYGRRLRTQFRETSKGRGPLI